MPMSTLGELVLVMGDTHIPHRATDIPSKFKRMFIPNKMQHVICTGNIGHKQKTHEELRLLAPNVHIVSGDYDNLGTNYNPEINFPETKVIEIGEFRIGVIHGHQVVPWGNHAALSMTGRKLNVDILISGHTHQNEVVEYEGLFHINPGSITGAFSPMTAHVTPSFVLLAVQGPKVICYVYELIEGEVDVSKTEFTKPK